MPPVNKKIKAKKQKAENVEIEQKEAVVSGQLLKKMEKKEQRKNMKKERGVVLIKHLPHGFFEEQLKNYFEQFGKVTRLRLVRSRKTGGSKGFAFVEFEYPEVAQVAADTMDNYLMFQKLVKAAYIPPDKQLYNYFRSTVRKIKNKAGKTIFVSKKTAAIKHKAKEHNNWTDDKIKQNSETNLKKIKKLNDKYAHLGLDFSQICMGGKAIGEKSDIKKPEKKNSSLELEDLLGATIQEDTDDEDWHEGSDDISEEEYASSLYIDDDEDENDSEGELNDESVSDIKAAKKTKVLGKQKQHFGGIQKMSKKSSIKKPAGKQTKNPLMVKMIKEAAKPMEKINHKPKSLKKKNV